MRHGAGGELFFVETIGFSLLALGFSSLVVYAAATDDAATLMQRLSSRALTDFGKYSYGNLRVPRCLILGAFVFAIRKGPFGSVRDDFTVWCRVCRVARLATSFLVAKVSYECFSAISGLEAALRNTKRSAKPAINGVPMGA